VKQGEMNAIVHATGVNTFFGKAADLVNRSTKKSHIHFVLKSIAYFCLVFISIGVTAELITEFGIRGKPCTGTALLRPSHMRPFHSASTDGTYRCD